MAKLLGYLSQVNVKIAELKNRLSHYLREVRKGETVIVYDRDEPVAVLSSIHPAHDRKRERETLLAAARKVGLKLEIPEQCGEFPLADIHPTVAPDGRTDLATIDFTRGGRDY
jgi:prevent-host-death family protein